MITGIPAVTFNINCALKNGSTGRSTDEMIDICNK